jgi:hypothetical protein
MDFLIADTFTTSLGRLTPQEQKAAKVTAFELQIDPSSPGLSFHKLDRAQDKNFWSVRVNSDIRIIVHKTPNSFLLAYVDHHDAAYAWAERRKLERHPTTGAMQLVEVRQTVENRVVVVPTAAPEKPEQPAPPPAKPQVRLFEKLRKPELMAFGVPEEWIEDVRAATEDTLLDVIAHLPQEAGEALLRLAVGERPEPQPVAEPGADPFKHPDAQRRFRVMTNVDELRLALEAPWDKWTVFLHPAQADLTRRHFNGPARVAGSAGTGKTIVALHRAVALARKNPNAKVLLTTFSKALANAIRRKLVLLAGDDVALTKRITVDALSNVGYDLYSKANGQPNIAPVATVTNLLMKAAGEVKGHKFSKQFLVGEWSDIVDAWHLSSWEAYRDVPRLGRRTRVGGKQREVLWTIFERLRAMLAERKLVTWSDVFAVATDACSNAKAPIFDFAVVDECQDLSVPQARFLAALGGGRPNALFFAGDTGQRIFQSPFSWKALGLDVRGRATTLRINYRTSHQIRTQADGLLPGMVADVDGNEESRKGTVSLFDGPAPRIELLASQDAECAAVADWIKARVAGDCKPEEIAVFVRSERELSRARAAVKAAGQRVSQLDDKSDVETGAVTTSTMHLAKGHEFRAVAVMCCDEDVLPLVDRINTAADEGELDEVYNTERHLLYVACTRARDWLLVTGVKPGSEFVADLAGTVGVGASL